MSLYFDFILETIELVCVFILFTKGKDWLIKSKYQRIRNQEFILRMLPLLYFFSQLMGILLTIGSNSLNLTYILFFERIGKFYSAHLSTDLLWIILFFAICSISYYQKRDIRLIDTYFASVFVIDMDFIHELIWCSINIFVYGKQINFTYLFLTQFSYIEAVIILTILLFKLKSNWISFRAFGLSQLIQIPYYYYWVSVGFPITVMNITKTTYEQTQFFNSLFVNEIEVCSWLLIFSIFALNLLGTLLYKRLLVYKAENQIKKIAREM